MWLNFAVDPTPDADQGSISTFVNILTLRDRKFYCLLYTAKHSKLFSRSFYRATGMHNADYAVARFLPACLSVPLFVCLSICLSHADILSKRLILNFFPQSGSSTVLVFPHQTGWQYSDGDLLTGLSNAREVWKKSRFSTNISLYLGNDARYSHSYYRRRISNRTQAISSNDLEWPLTPISRSYYSTSNNSKTVQDRAIFTMLD